MRAALTILMLLIVVAVVGVNVRNELRATALAGGAAGAASGASAPFGGTSSPNVGQFKRELDRTMQGVNERAASAGDAADTQR